MVDIVRLQNYKRSLEVYSSTEGFENEALGAMIGLTLYASLTHQAQSAWITAAQRATSYTGAAGAAKSFFYSGLIQKRLMAFGSGVGSDLGSFMFESFPWGLPDSLFDQVYGDLKQGKGKAHETEGSWQDAAAYAGDLSKTVTTKAAEFGPVVALAGFFARKFAAQYVPEAAALLANPMVLAVGTAVAWSAVEVHQYASKLDNHFTRQRYDKDAERRAYDRRSPLLADH